MEAKCHPERKHYAKGLCQMCYMRKLKRDNPAWAKRRRQKNKAWREANADKIRDYRKKQWKTKRLENHGLTLQDEKRMLRQQKGGCGICGVKHNGNRAYFDIDHDHVTGKVRGLLCAKCNKGIGLLGDSANGVAKALDYLQRHERSVA